MFNGEGIMASTVLVGSNIDFIKHRMAIVIAPINNTITALPSMTVVVFHCCITVKSVSMLEHNSHVQIKFHSKDLSSLSFLS